MGVGEEGTDGRTDGRTDGGGLRRGKEGQTQSDEEKGREFMEELSQGEREYAKTGPAKTRLRTETGKYPTHRDTHTRVLDATACNMLEVMVLLLVSQEI